MSVKNNFLSRFDFLRLDAPLSSRLKLVLLTFAFPAKRILKLSPQIPTSVELRVGKNKGVAYIQNYLDLSVIREVFIFKEYDIATEKEPKVIFDLGSNVGISVLFLKLKYPNAKIYAFEPDPTNYKQLVKNTAAYSDIKACNYVIQAQDGEASFFVYPNSGTSSSQVKRSDKQNVITIQGRSLSSLAQEFNLNSIDILKFDIEGGEMDAFTNQPIVAATKILIGEFHADLTGKTLQEFEALFPSHKATSQQISSTRYIVDLRKTI